MLNIALFGAPGAGKGTQSELLMKKHDLVYIATGDILREEMAEGTALGESARDIIEAGGLVPDEIIVHPGTYSEAIDFLEFYAREALRACEEKAGAADPR